MTNVKCGHEESRGKCCGTCGKKINFGTRPSTAFLIKPDMEQTIKELLNPEFDLSSQLFPTSQCSNCRLTLSSWAKGDRKRKLPYMPNFKDLVVRKKTRSDVPCNCYICLTARYKGQKKAVIGRGNSTPSVEITESNGLHGSVEQVVDVAAAQKDQVKTVSVLCKTCKQSYGRGISHRCALSDAAENVAGLVKTLPTKVQEQVITTLLKEKKSPELSLATKGTPLRVAINPKPVSEPVVFSETGLDNFRSTNQLSGKFMGSLCNFVRTEAGKKAIPAHFRSHSADTSMRLDDLYHVDTFNMDTENGIKARPVVYADCEEILDKVVEERGYVGRPSVLAMADGGQGFLKICLTILPQDYETEAVDSDSDIDQPPKPKRSTYAEGGSMKHKRKLTGVNRLIMVCTVPDVKETWKNMELLFSLSKLNNIPYKFVSDYKLLLICLGLQTAVSSFPSPYCHVSLRTLRNKAEPDVVDGKGCGDPRTFGSLRKDHEKFLELKCNKARAKDCYSTVNPPIFCEDDSVLVSEKCIFPELHNIMGVVNHTFFKGVVPTIGEDKAFLWPQKLGVAVAGYHGRTFEGGACRKMCKNSDRLLGQDVLGSTSPLILQPYVAFLKSMDKVVVDCFSTGKVGTDLKSHLSDLQVHFEATGLSETLKIHVVLKHIPECLAPLNGHGFGLYSEQAGESIHRVFLRIWSRYKINDIEHPDFRENLRKSVVEFSSFNI